MDDWQPGGIPSECPCRPSRAESREDISMDTETAWDMSGLTVTIQNVVRPKTKITNPKLSPPQGFLEKALDKPHEGLLAVLHAQPDLWDMLSEAQSEAESLMSHLVHLILLPATQKAGKWPKTLAQQHQESLATAFREVISKEVCRSGGRVDKEQAAGLYPVPGGYPKGYEAEVRSLVFFRADAIPLAKEVIAICVWVV